MTRGNIERKYNTEVRKKEESDESDSDVEMSYKSSK